MSAWVQVHAFLPMTALVAKRFLIDRPDSEEEATTTRPRSGTIERTVEPDKPDVTAVTTTTSTTSTDAAVILPPDTELLRGSAHDLVSVRAADLARVVFRTHPLLAPESGSRIVHDVHWAASDEGRSILIAFRCADVHADAVLNTLAEQIGLGREELPQLGTVTVLPVELVRPRPRPTEATTAAATPSDDTAVVERVLVDKLLDQIERGGMLSFDYVSLISLASILAAVGLATNNAVVIVASMLVSPLMGPILAVTFGLFVWDRRLTTLSAVSAGIGSLACILIGFLAGLIVAPLAESQALTGGTWPTPEMAGRGSVVGLIAGVVIALASGGGVALGIAGNNVSGLVGVAISASLLPPLVNCGMLWGYALSTTWLSGPVARAADASELVRLGGFSCLLSVVNIACILVSASAMFYIKEVAPLPGKSPIFAVTHAIRSEQPPDDTRRPIGPRRARALIRRRGWHIDIPITSAPAMGGRRASIAGPAAIELASAVVRPRRLTAAASAENLESAAKADGGEAESESSSATSTTTTTAAAAAATHTRRATVEPVAIVRQLDLTDVGGDSLIPAFREPVVMWATPQPPTRRVMRTTLAAARSLRKQRSEGGSDPAWRAAADP